MYKTVLKIDGMACSMCETHINDLVRRTLPVKKVSSSHSKGETVIISEDHIDEEKLKKELTAIGYELQGSHEEPYEKKGLFGLFK